MDTKAILGDADEKDVEIFRDLSLQREGKKQQLEQIRKDIKEFDVLIQKKYKEMTGQDD